MSEEKVIKYSLIWRIKNFSLCNLKKGDQLTSPIFTTESFGGSRWTIDFKPKGGILSPPDFMSCNLCKKENDEFSETITIDYTMEMSGADGEVLLSKKSENVSITPGYFYGWHDFIKIGDVEEKMKNWPDDTLTIRCDLFSSLKPIEYEAHTILGVNKHSVLWNVKIPGKSQDVKLISFSNFLQFEMRVTAVGDDIKIVIGLRKNKQKLLWPLNRFFIGKLTLIDLKGNEISSKKATYLFEKEKDEFEFPAFITKNQLIDNKSCYIEDGCFSLLGEFSVSNGIEYSTILNSDLSSSLKANTISSNLEDDLKNMFWLKKHTDVNLIVENQIISAHKSILSARSPVFDAMFNSDMIENKTGEVNILDVDLKTMNSFLEYLYTGKMNDMVYLSAKNLLELAERYQVTSLRDECAEFLISSLTIRNVCDLLAIADMIAHKRLKKSAMDYITQNSSKVLVSLEWNELMENNSKLASDVVSNIAVNFKFTPLTLTKK